MSGHEAVKAALVEHLTALLPTWLAAVRDGDTWPPDPRLIAASDILPDKDEQWPCVLVSSTSMTRALSDGAETLVGDYGVQVSVAARAKRERDVESAAVARDRMLAAVRWLVLSHPGVTAHMQVLGATLTEETDPVGLDLKGRPAAVGAASFTVRFAETIPTIPDSIVGTVTDADVTVSAVDAATDLL